MKKLLMITTAIAGVAMLSAPASAAIDLNLGGYFLGYVVDTDNDLTNVRETEFRRATSLTVSGETTLENGLTVGASTDLSIAEAGVATVTADAVFAYAQGGWGRVEMGDNDGAAYLLQVAAPSADSNVDGILPDISGLDVDTGVGMAGLSSIGTDSFDSILDYNHSEFSEVDRLTYITPKYNGFQAGVSYAFEPAITTNVGAMNNTDNDAGDYDKVMEVAARYTGEYQGFAFDLGAGYSVAKLEAKEVVLDNTSDAAAAAADPIFQTDDVDTYNFGATVAFKEFSLGASYMLAQTEFSADTDVDAVANIDLVSTDFERETYVIGGAYDNGPYHVGVSYLNQQTTRDAIVSLNDTDANDASYDGIEKEVDRLTVGGGYSFGPGITFRGSIGWGTVETKNKDVVNPTVGAEATLAGDTAAKRDFTQVTVGTDVRF